MIHKKQPVEVLLLDDELEVTDGLIFLLNSIKIPCRAFTSHHDFLSYIATAEGPICAVIDLRMPEISGLELQQNLINNGYRFPIMFLTAHGDVTAAVSAIKSGALDFILKPLSPEPFLAAINQLIRTAQAHYEYQLKSETNEGLLSKLSPREKEILNSLIEGKTSKELARIYNISPKTVDVHRSSILKKTNSTSVIQLARTLNLSQ